MRGLCLGLFALVGCKSSEPAQVTPNRPPAKVAHEELASGDVRLYSGTIADLDGDGTLELAAGGFATSGGHRRATVFIYRQAGDKWDVVTEGGWLGGGGGNGSTVRNIEVADLDGDGKPEIIALGRVGSKTQEASARLVVLALRDGALREVAKAEWNDARYTHGYGLAIGDLDGDRKLDIATTGFLFDGEREHGFVRVWSYTDRTLVMRAETKLSGDHGDSVRINDVSIADVDRDGRMDLVTVGRSGPYHPDGTNDDLSARRETGDLVVLDGATLEIRARQSWIEGSSLRLRTVAIADLDGTGAPEIVVGGQYDADGKPCLAVFEAGARTLTQRARAVGDTTGEIKDLLISGSHIIATGPTGAKPARQGDVATWQFRDEKLVRESEVTSINGTETRARAAVIAPDGNVMTIGYAKTSAAVVGQLLLWPVAP